MFLHIHQQLNINTFKFNRTHTPIHKTRIKNTRSIISGFITPLRNEHLLFFEEVFLKLHSCHMFPVYFENVISIIPLVDN